ncbi:MAG TPA: hypothetical protein VGL06_01200 [Pseudonocardiaceae bacterium]
MGEPRIAVAEAAGVGIDGLDRPTEDHVVLLPTAVILADGATALRDDELSGGWYAEHLCQGLATHLTDQPTADLRALLSKTITDLSREHLLTPGSAPSSTVAVLRWTDDRVDALVLADSPIVAFTRQGPQVLADDRIANLAVPGGGYRQRLRAGGGYGPDHVAALRAAGNSFGQRRNVPGGFWVAEADPAAATQARTASWPRADVTAALLASDGVSCGVDDYRLFDWPTVLALATDAGPAAVLAEVRNAERADPDGLRWPRPKRHDDQALVLVRF